MAVKVNACAVFSRKPENFGASFSQLYKLTFTMMIFFGETQRVLISSSVLHVQDSFWNR